ncbi:MAG: cation diffusion facilitator family transporter [Lachnospiraceae bacterium]|nr:cation diffusion facilitator family transporter [Lachnospiraceae bacterium]
MVEFIGNYFVNKKDAKDSALKTRQIYGTVCSIIGIMLNVCLFAGKYFAGAISGSIAIMADAVNNLSDAGSSFITLIGFRFAGKKPDVDHPFGHGRFEYISGFVVSMAIIMMGFELIKSSFAKIITPVKIETGILSMIILVVSILVKLYMAYMNRSIGNKINSSAMKATAVDSLSDACATFFVLVSMIVIRVSGLNIDGYVGVLVSLFIFYAGYNAAKDTIDPLLGKNPEPEFVEAVKNIVMSHENVVGIHDMVVHDYGPGRVMVSLHAEVPGDGDIFELHDAIDHIERELTEELGCSAVIHMDPIETNNEIVNALREKVNEGVVLLIEGASIHDFRMVQGPTHTNLIFDVVVPYGVKESDEQVKEKISKMVQIIDETYFTVINIDRLYIN